MHVFCSLRFKWSIRMFCFVNIITLALIFHAGTRLEESQMGSLFYLWVSLFHISLAISSCLVICGYVPCSISLTNPASQGDEDGILFEPLVLDAPNVHTGSFSN